MKAIKTGDGNPKFKYLIEFVSIILILPHSSAAIERIFFTINLNKNKIRNRLSVETLNGILHAQRLIEKNCYNLKVSKDMLKNISIQNTFKVKKAACHGGD